MKGIVTSGGGEFKVEIHGKKHGAERRSAIKFNPLLPAFWLAIFLRPATLHVHFVARLAQW
jgi:hypothetical protein